MKNQLALGIGLMAALSLAPSVWAKSFSNKDLKGTYTEKFSGLVGQCANPFPARHRALRNREPAPKPPMARELHRESRFQYRRLDLRGTVTGTYQVKADGSGTSTGTFTPNVTAPTGVPGSNYRAPRAPSG